MQRHLVPVLAAAPLVLMLASVPASAQAWCRNVGLSDAERLICRTPALQTLDRRLNATFRAAIKATKEGSGVGIRESQHLWLGRRNGCGRDRDCIAASYAKRIADLEHYMRTGDLDID